jgi:antitoxin component YwqK of YwqJK toxin-antitoxin module
MKKILVLAAVVSLNLLSAQQINDKGLYVTSNNELFNGIVVSNVGDVKFKVTVKDGVISGEADYFYPSGKIMETGVFSGGKKDQKWTRFNENGTTSAIAFYTSGKKSGTWAVFDNDGKKRFEMQYENGEKAGVWTNWDEHGIVVNTKNYSTRN